MWVKDMEIVLDQVGHIEKDFIKTKALDAFVPGVGSQERIELLRCISEEREIFAIDDDKVWADLLGIRYQHQLLDTSASSLVVTGGQNALLFHP